MRRAGPTIRGLKRLRWTEPGARAPSWSLSKLAGTGFN